MNYPNLDSLISHNDQQYRLWSMIAKMGTKNTNIIRAYLRSLSPAGFSTTDDETKREESVKWADKAYRQIMKGEKPADWDDHFYAQFKVALGVIMEVNDAMSTVKNRANVPIEHDGIFAKIRGIEATMTDIAKQLPGIEYVRSIKGFGELSFAKIIGCTGDLRNYNNPGKVWRRMGLAPFRGKACATWKKGGLSAEDWIEAGYSPKRRSEIWNVGDVILKTMRVVRDDDGEDTGERIHASHLTRIYMERKAYELPRVPPNQKGEPNAGHAHNRAKRYMEKRLLAELWAAWNEACGVDVSDKIYMEAA